MAYTKIVFKNPKTGKIEEAPVGFSWTVFFFGIFPPLFRGDWKWFIIMILLALFTFGLSHLVFIFIYNKLYIKDLINAGFKAKSIGWGTIDEASQKIGVRIPMLNSGSEASKLMNDFYFLFQYHFR
ncbi:hypothetical protein COT82_00195 [Candidatus Campbellbacteria bacterium CG10_big_fil_rev_8_21_14_0_10_35_52]|uniref:DUF2628 domain-containing protein n=1 Tax=Candidatus Campbellbacteria bacterium CG10_big_fil_rev_8_21_14_0_10_35_52 TaxID=1974527 RepID=A0A2M6WW00_9BACT|nr:MAG: hypothetical protein COT82_00195 [Candidatus Campbellbacteria bacterium CG10_big_fil_rev_8_21_14_0_10_35_52]